MFNNKSETDVALWCYKWTDGMDWLGNRVKSTIVPTNVPPIIISVAKTNRLYDDVVVKLPIIIQVQIQYSYEIFERNVDLTNILRIFFERNRDLDQSENQIVNVGNSGKECEKLGND